MSEQQEPTTDTETTEPVDMSGDDGMTADQRKIIAWHDAVEAAPSDDEIAELRSQVAAAEAELKAVSDRHQAAAAQRACVHGWLTVGEQEGVSAKRVHMWHREQVPTIPDLSMVPEREMKREEKRIETLEQKAEQAAELQRRATAQREKYLAKMKARGEL